MLFDDCRAQADGAASEKVPMDLSMPGMGKEGKGDNKGKRGKDGDGKDDKKGKGKQGKGKDNAKAIEYFEGSLFGCKKKKTGVT